MSDYNVVMYMKKKDSAGRMQKILVSVDIGKTYSMLDLLSNSITNFHLFYWIVK